MNNPNAFVIPHAADQWSEVVRGQSFRVAKDQARGLCLFRKTIDPDAFGGYVIHRTPIDGPIGKAWLQRIVIDTARSPEIGQ